MRYNLARFLAALGLALAVAGPAKAGVIWDVTLTTTGVKAVAPLSIRVGPYGLDMSDVAAGGVDEFATKATCSSDTVTIPSSYSWHAMQYELNWAPTFGGTPWVSSGLPGQAPAGQGLTSDNLKKAAWLTTQFRDPSVTNQVVLRPAAQVSAIHEAIWKLTDSYYKGNAYPADNVNTGSNWWLDQVNGASAEAAEFIANDSDAADDWQQYVLLMPMQPVASLTHPSMDYETVSHSDTSLWTYVDSPKDPVPPNSQPFLVRRWDTPPTSIEDTPEPGSMGLLLMGLGLVGLVRRRSRSTAS